METERLPYHRRTDLAKPQCTCRKHKRCMCTGPLCKMPCSRDPRHGTVNGNTNLKCRCDPCTAAGSRNHYEVAQRAKQRPIPEHVHGTPNGYGYWGCRERCCTDAWTKESYERKERSRLGLTDCAQGIYPKPKKRS
jgi:hypothetical protein